MTVWLAVWAKAGMPRSMAAAWRAASSSIWVSLAVAAARLTLSPSASPAQRCWRASAIRSRRLLQMPARRGRWAGSGRRTERRQTLRWFGQRDVRCPLLRVDPAQKPRLEEIHANLGDRLQEAKEHGWLGEVAAIETTLSAAAQKLKAMRELTARSITVHLGMPDPRSMTGRSSPDKG